MQCFASSLVCAPVACSAVAAVACCFLIFRLFPADFTTADFFAACSVASASGAFAFAAAVAVAVAPASTSASAFIMGGEADTGALDVAFFQGSSGSSSSSPSHCDQRVGFFSTCIVALIGAELTPSGSNPLAL